MAAHEVLTEQRGQSLIITFNRPDHANALTMDMASQLFNILKNVTTDRSVRAVLFCGAGGNYMDGLDMSFFRGDMNKALENANALIMPFHSAIRELMTMDKPVLSMVEGHVTGTGFSLMLASDLVIAGKSARFNTGFAEYGLAPTGGCSFFLPRKVGLSRAVEIMMLCEDFDAPWAERLRIVNKVADDATLKEEALAWLDKLAVGPTKALGAIKKLSSAAFEKDIHAHLGLEHNFYGQTSRSFDFRDVVKAHTEGRPPRFTGT